MIECATVKAVTTFATSMNALRNDASGCHRAAAPDQHRRQQQRQQEQDVVEAEPDVPDALVHVGRELRERTAAVAADDTFAAFRR